MVVEKIGLRITPLNY